MGLIMKFIKQALLIFSFFIISCSVYKKTEPHIIVDVETDDNRKKEYEKKFESTQKYFQRNFKDFDWNRQGVYLIEDNPYVLSLFFFNPNDSLHQVEILRGSQNGEMNQENKCTFKIQLDSVEFLELVNLRIDEIPKATPYINGKYPYPPDYGFKFIGYRNSLNEKKYFYFETIKQRPASKKKDGTYFYLFPYMKIPLIFDVYENVLNFVQNKIYPKVPKEDYNKCYSYSLNIFDKLDVEI